MIKEKEPVWYLVLLNFSTWRRIVISRVAGS